MTGYLVAQVGDRVQIQEPGRHSGMYGHVVRQRAAAGATVRVCDVALDGSDTITVYADYLFVVTPRRTT